ncbi:hypothetical protein CcNV_052 [Crangon crangon nudivirus]|uniref:Uncharacterized protein n=1 Tax=Crangon crangon nudivirus TaxID=2880838 RepID=A0AAE8XZW9_9VIRU|nr:hypothetical protein QKT25_gp052 [Crangon crangon nudivirus]UBZ25536.1 hypothetical protein CcNV_052 [Crangon crangon nudivirus]
MISFSTLAIVFVILLVVLLLYAQSSYYANIFVAYRNKAKIKTAPTDQLDRVLTFGEYYLLLQAIVDNMV